MCGYHGDVRRSMVQRCEAPLKPFEAPGVCPSSGWISGAEGSAPQRRCQRLFPTLKPYLTALDAVRTLRFTPCSAHKASFIWVIQAQIKVALCDADSAELGPCSVSGSCWLPRPADAQAATSAPLPEKTQGNSWEGSSPGAFTGESSRLSGFLSFCLVMPKQNDKFKYFSTTTV